MSRLKKNMILALAISIMIHLLVTVGVYLLANLSQSDVLPIVDAVLVDESHGWQTVDIPEPLKQEKPDNAKYLGQYDMKTNHETVQDPRLTLPSREAARSSAGGNPPPPLDPSKLTSFDRQLFAMNDARPSPKGAKSTLQTEVSEQLGKESGVLPEEYFNDYRFGEHTYLNVLRHPDVEYFVRLRRVFRLAWNPIPVVRQALAFQQVTRGQVRVVLAVTVNKKGELDELFVLHGSGVPGYDDEALRTVKASSPFSTPPTKFLENDGRLRMCWSFIVYM